MNTWIDERPQRAKKRDIMGKRLMVKADSPPKESNIRGMSEVTVFSVKDTSERWSILATQQDIDMMVEAYKQAKPFTFYKQKETDEYASVQIVEAETFEQEK